MKSLIEYIRENREDIVSLNENSIKFNFDGMDNSKDIIKQLKDIQSASVNDNEVEVMCDANVDELNKIYDILKKYSDSERKSQHRASDENYAKKTVKFENKVNELKEQIDKLENPEVDDKKSDDKKEKCDDKKCDKKKEEE